jgi:hypothetical protein
MSRRPKLRVSDALDALFEAEARAAWEAYQLTGETVQVKALDGKFDAALAGAKARGRAPTPAKRRGR